MSIFLDMMDLVPKSSSQNDSEVIHNFKEMKFCADRVQVKPDTVIF